MLARSSAVVLRVGYYILYIVYTVQYCTRSSSHTDDIMAMATPSSSGQDDQEMQYSTQEMATNMSQAYSSYPIVNVDEQVSCCLLYERN